MTNMSEDAFRMDDEDWEDDFEDDDENFE